jgi:transcriptional regulator with XRE-family HTH domain
VSKSVRTRAHDAVVSVLVGAREKAGITQRELADRLPAWLEWGHTTVAKIETNRRNLSFVEVREIAKVLGMDIATVDRRAAELAAAHRAPAGRGRPKGRTRPPRVR